MISLIALVVACTEAAESRDAEVATAPCPVEAPESCPDPAPVYKDVASIVKQRCESCHSPKWTGPWPLNTYENLSEWQGTVRSTLLDCSMPPPEEGLTMPIKDRMLILNWLHCGLPQ